MNIRYLLLLFILGCGQILFGAAVQENQEPSLEMCEYILNMSGLSTQEEISYQSTFSILDKFFVILFINLKISLIII